MFERNINQDCYIPPRKRYFAVSEANKALVLVKRIVADVVFDYALMMELQEMIDVAHEGRLAAATHQDELQKVVQQIRLCLEELDDIGVELTDWSLGIVDFPSRFDGKEIRLCWHFCEDKVSHWHEINESFCARQPIETLAGLQTAAR